MRAKEVILCYFRSILRAASFSILLAAPSMADQTILGQRSIQVATYHYDNGRTGWNSDETTLTPESIQKKKFGLLKSVKLDDADEQIDAQPLFLSNQDIEIGKPGATKKNIIYVVTSRNNVYGIDTDTQSVVLRQALGPAVPVHYLPGECHNSGNTVGILSTPAISDGSLYLVSYQLSGGSPVYYIYALDLKDLHVIKKRKIESERLLSNGDTFRFSASVQRQRAGLLIANNNVYAAFASFCDMREDVSRGWILGWNKETLEPIAAAFLTNTLSPTGGDIRFKNDDGLIQNPFSFYLSSIWMSGYGIAADSEGDLYFVTGNSTKYATTYNPPNNLQNSVVRISGALTQVKSWFSPSSAHEYPNSLCWNTPPPAKCHKGVFELDNADLDFGSGGVMLLPDQPGNAHLAVAAGKVGQLFLLDRDRMGGYGVNVDDSALQMIDMGGIDSCYCGPSYYEAEVKNSRVGRVVTSIGNTIRIFEVTSENGSAHLTPFGSASSALQSTSPPTGFFTSISSNGTIPNTAVIWAVSRPVSKKNDTLLLYAFDPSNMTNAIFRGAAGIWPNVGGKPNAVPVVADGKVFVGSFGEVDIFGLDAPATQDLAAARPGAELSVVLPKPQDQNPRRNRTKIDRAVVFGKVIDERGRMIKIRRRNGEKILIDTATARQNHLAGNTSIGKALEVIGYFDEGGVLHANSIKTAQPAESLWDEDNFE